MVPIGTTLGHGYSKGSKEGGNKMCLVKDHSFQVRFLVSVEMKSACSLDIFRRNRFAQLVKPGGNIWIIYCCSDLWSCVSRRTPLLSASPSAVLFPLFTATRLLPGLCSAASAHHMMAVARSFRNNLHLFSHVNLME